MIYLTLILEVLKIGLAIFGQAMIDKAKADAANEKFVIDMARRKAWADAALLKLLMDSKKDSQDADSSWGKQDGDTKP